MVYPRPSRVTQNLGDFKFPGRGQKNTPVMDARGIVEIVMLLGGRQAREPKISNPALKRHAKGLNPVLKQPPGAPRV